MVRLAHAPVSIIIIFLGEETRVMCQGHMWLNRAESKFELNLSSPV